jgi:hypothetical protein
VWDPIHDSVPILLIGLVLAEGRASYEGTMSRTHSLSLTAIPDHYSLLFPMKRLEYEDFFLLSKVLLNAFKPCLIRGYTIWLCVMPVNESLKSFQESRVFSGYLHIRSNFSSSLPYR